MKSPLRYIETQYVKYILIQYVYNTVKPRLSQVIGTRDQRDGSDSGGCVIKVSRLS